MLALLAIVVLALSSGRLGAPASTPPQPMPPHPDLLKRLEERGEELPAIITDPKLRRARGIDQPTTPPQKVTGTWKALALLVDFTDNPSQVGAGFFDTLLFAAPANSMRDYYNEVSYGTFDVVTVDLPSSTGWQRAPQTYAYYTAGGAFGLGAYPNNAQRLTEDAVALADPLVNFANYDNDGDGWVDALFIIHAGPGAEFTGMANHIWSHAWVTFTPQPVDGVNVWRYSMEPEFWAAAGDMTHGVYDHEFGHVLGLPDLYDTDGSSEGIGRWSIMASGSWNGPWPGGGSPAHPDAWSRMQLGWVAPAVIATDTPEVNIPAVETNPTVYYVWNNGAPNNEYFLVENRQQTGYDTYLPSNGLLIWHVDDNKTTNRGECRNHSNCLCANHYLVALEQADGNMNLEWKNNRGDDGDPYPGTSNNRTFDLASTPNCGSYANCSSFVEVLNISNSGAIMTADINVLGAPAPPVADFMGAPTRGPAPLTVNFTDLSTGNIASWSWSFGDGATSTLQTPSHTYNNPGLYTVSLTVTGPGGSDTETKPDYIQVTVANLLSNGSFEDDGSIPAPWRGRNLTLNDRRVCDVALDGSCSFKMVGSTTAKKVLGQVVKISGSAGKTFTLSGWSKAENASPTGKHYCVGVKVVHTDGTKEKFKTCFNKSTHGWEYGEKAFTAAKDYNKIVVYLRYKKQSGKVWWDYVWLVRH